MTMTLTLTLTMMMKLILFATLFLTLAKSITSAFSSDSITSSQRLFTLTPPRPTVIFATLFDNIDIDNNSDVSLHHSSRSLLETTVDDVIVTSTTNAAMNNTSSMPAAAPTDNKSTALAPALALPYDKIKNIWNTDQKLKKRYGVVVGRFMILCISFLPLITRHHEMQMGMHKEEYLIQLFLLGVTMDPLKKSAKLAKCMMNSKTGCIDDECRLELEDLEKAFDIDNKPRT